MSASSNSRRVAQDGESCGHDHYGCCSGQLTFGPDGRLVLSVVCDHCGETVAVLGPDDYELAAKLGHALDLAA